MKKKKVKGIEYIKSIYGYKFIAPWAIGLILFFIVPLIQSVMFSFSTVSLEETGLVLKNIKLENYKSILFADPNYIENLTTAVTSFLKTFPIVFILSLILAILLNGEFKGRLFFRGMYFLPVIIATGVVLEKILFMMGDQDLASAGVSQSLSSTMMPLDSVIKRLGLPEPLVAFLSSAVSEIFDMIWKCGIPIVLFIAGLQTIPDSLYEVAKVEGTTKWEEFWYITLPMLSRVLLLVAVFISVIIMTEKTNVIMTEAYNQMGVLEYGVSAAMLWFYFIIIGVILALLMLFYQKVCVKRWE